MEAHLKEEALWMLKQGRIFIRGRIGFNKRQDVGQVGAIAAYSREGERVCVLDKVREQADEMGRIIPSLSGANIYICSKMAN